MSHLSNGGFEQVGPSLFGAPRVTGTNETLFGSTVHLSSNGLHLAVGAPGHDVDPSSIGSGAVHLHNYNPSTAEWDVSFTIVGQPGEGIGSFTALSSDGSRVAIRRLPDAASANHVEIYNTSTGNRLGSSLACEERGSSVAISKDGNRVAVSCERFGVNQGVIKVFEWNGVEWSPIGNIDGVVIGISNQGLLGWATAFADSGNRLAVSAPLFSSDGISRRGVVKVFDYNVSSNSWDQVGNDLLGLRSMDKFGLSLDLSGDGSTLFIGNPRHGTNGVGRVEAFAFDSGSWIPRGSLVEGINDSDAFGASVSSSFDGNSFVASSPNYDGGRGQVRLIQFDGIAWNDEATVEGLDSGDGFGGSRNTVSLSGDGLRFAAGSKMGMNNADATGRVRVFDFVLPPAAPSQDPSSTTNTPAPSLYPSAFPIKLTLTKHPTVSEAPSMGSSSLPSDKPSFGPSGYPSDGPSNGPSDTPSLNASDVPSGSSSTIPSTHPSKNQSQGPSSSVTLPSLNPSVSPTNHHLKRSSTLSPTTTPAPSLRLSSPPSYQPSISTSLNPSNGSPSASSTRPSAHLSLNASVFPTNHPPTKYPTGSQSPSNEPTFLPSGAPFLNASNSPSDNPSGSSLTNPSAYPSRNLGQDLNSIENPAPFLNPSISLTNNPSISPTNHSLKKTSTLSPTRIPAPSSEPSSPPSYDATVIPSANPSDSLSDGPSLNPSNSPSRDPSTSPSAHPSDNPSNSPKEIPAPTASFLPTLDQSSLEINSAAPSILLTEFLSRSSDASNNGVTVATSVIGAAGGVAGLLMVGILWRKRRQNTDQNSEDYLAEVPDV